MMDWFFSRTCGLMLMGACFALALVNGINFLIEPSWFMASGTALPVGGAVSVWFNLPE